LSDPSCWIAGMRLTPFLFSVMMVGVFGRARRW